MDDEPPQHFERVRFCRDLEFHSAARHGIFQQLASADRAFRQRTPQADGTLVRMEHSGFRPEDEGGYRGMGGGWPRIVERLEAIAGR